MDWAYGLELVDIWVTTTWICPTAQFSIQDIMMSNLMMRLLHIVQSAGTNEDRCVFPFPFLRGEMVEICMYVISIRESSDSPLSIV